MPGWDLVKEYTGIQQDGFRVGGDLQCTAHDSIKTTSFFQHLPDFGAGIFGSSWLLQKISLP